MTEVLLISFLVFYVVTGFDDFFVDFLAFFLDCRPRRINMSRLRKILALPEKRLAVLVASWKEEGVLEKMVRGNLRSVTYENFDFILGVYPNDPATLAEARSLSERFPNVKVVVNSLPGPTSKGQMLNEMVLAAEGLGRVDGRKYDGYVIQDSEDLIHRYGLSIMNWQLKSADFVQIPVFSLPLRKTEWVAATYADEFAESHTKDILVRGRLGASIPSAGVGTAVSSELVQRYLSIQNGELLNERSLTEDYELGVATSRHGFRSVIACFYFRNEKDEVEFIATREFFPKSVSRSIRQKARWTTGIAFQGFRNLGWSRSIVENYFLFRDRKGPYANLMVFAGWLVSAWVLMGWVEHRDFLLLREQWVQRLLYVNAFFMLNRAFQRVRCATRIYGFAFAIMGILRVPVSNFINAVSGIVAIRQYVYSRVFNVPLKWVKTEHELPVGFGLAPVDTEIPATEKSA